MGWAKPPSIRASIPYAPAEFWRCLANRAAECRRSIPISSTARGRFFLPVPAWRIICSRATNSSGGPGMCWGGSLQAKLTLGSVGLVSLMVAVVSAVDLANEMQRQFESTLERANALKTVASRMVSQTLNRQRTVSFREALRDPDLQNVLVDVLSAGGAILEVAVVDTHNEVLLDSGPTPLGSTPPSYPNFQPLVTSSPWYDKLRLLLRRDPRAYYQLEQELGTPEGKPLLYVRIIIAPALIRDDINPTLRKDANVAILSVIVAVCLTFLLSAAAFRPLGQLGHLLDRVARGEYEPEKQPIPKSANDDVSVMASKVSLLSQRLRGAQYEVSDLRGNIDVL